MDLSWLPDDVDDRFIGYAILSVMFMLMLTWLFSPASPINVFKSRADFEHIVTQFYFVMYLIVPLALLGLVQSLTGHIKGGRVTGRVIGATERLRGKREALRQRIGKSISAHGPSHEFHKAGEALREHAPSKEFRKIHPRDIAARLREKRKAKSNA